MLAESKAELPERDGAVLLAVGALLGQEIALDDLLHTLVDRIAQSLNADRGTIYLVDAARGELFSQAAHLPELKEIRLKIGQGIAGQVAQNGRCKNVSYAQSEHDFFGAIDAQTGYQTRTLLAAPMRDHRGQIIGVIQLLNQRDGAFTPAHERQLERLARAASKALEVTSLYGELVRAESEPDKPVSYFYNHIIGESPAMRRVYSITQKAGRSDATVLLRGESGTGKELFARAVHVNSQRRAEAFIKVDCAALPASLIENELFGHEKGAYTGASRRTIGKFEAAQGGTIFIDEIGELPLSVQGKLLRALQDREFQRLGGHETVKLDVRVIAATHRNLEALVEKGLFRADLYYRIRVIEMVLPPLRARGIDDIRRLLLHFTNQVARRYDRQPPQFTPEAMARLLAYPWPGNVRELQNCIESAVVLADGPVIGAVDLPLPTRIPSLPEAGTPLGTDLGQGQATQSPPLIPTPGAPAAGERRNLQPVTDPNPADLTLDSVERAHILKVLKIADGNRSLAAKLLGIGRNTLGRKLKAWGMA